jgi:hypothetical protein
MFLLTRIPSLVAAGALAVLVGTSSPARAEEPAQNLASVGTHGTVFADQNSGQIGKCRSLRRAISRRTCQAGLWRSARVHTAKK